MKVVINDVHGGYSLSKAATIWLAERGHAGAKDKIAKSEALLEKYGKSEPGPGSDDYFERLNAIAWANGDDSKKGVFRSFSWRPWEEDDLPRHHELLVECVETLGDKSFGPCARLRAVEVPDGVEYEIEEYDGLEWVAEKHRTWR